MFIVSLIETGLTTKANNMGEFENHVLLEKFQTRKEAQDYTEARADKLRNNIEGCTSSFTSNNGGKTNEETTTVQTLEGNFLYYINEL